MSQPAALGLMYHRVDEIGARRQADLFERHLQQIVSAYPIVLPGDPLTAPLSVYLTFDDAYADFYSVVYPLLKAWRIKALLAVPTAYIIEDTHLPMAQRLQIPYPHGMEGRVYQDQVPFCTWTELREMVASGCVEIASHGHTHANMRASKVDFEQEVVVSKRILEQQLGLEVQHFVYPYGKWNAQVHRRIQPHYAYIHRIGHALNSSWKHPRQLYYRVDAEAFWTQSRPIRAQDLARWGRQYAWNRFWGR